MYVNYPRCPTCQSSMVECKRYVSLIKKIQDRIRNISTIPFNLSDSLESTLLPARWDTALENIKLPDKILAIVRRTKYANRQRELAELFVYVIELFQKISSRVTIERDQFLKCIYERVEENDSVFFTRQQWSDVEHEYNRLLFIDYFRTSKELLGKNFEKSDLETLNEILFESNTFSELACQVAVLLLKQDDVDNEYQWKSILPNELKWNFYEKDRLLCDGKYIVCPKG